MAPKVRTGGSATIGQAALPPRNIQSDDGTFVGQYHDSDMGGTGDDHPNGTVYICEFSGKFSMPKKLNEYIYTMNLDNIECSKSVGEIYYDNGVRYICTDPGGFEEAKEFLIYLPGTPLKDIDENFIIWSFVNKDIRKTLPSGYYGIYNVNGKAGFVGTINDAIWHKTYQYEHGMNRSELSPSYYGKSSLTFWPEQGGASLTLNFDWTEDDQQEFIATDADGSGDYDISLSFSEDLATVKIAVISRTKQDFSAWGGTTDGHLTAIYKYNE